MPSISAEEFSAEDYRYMARAIALARQGLYTTRPNPAVGCVLVSGGEVVGEGYHHIAGAPHAEIEALQAAGSKATGSVAYVTLEPCAHVGRTGPCAEALAKAGVSKVIAAMQDPNPAVSGKGFEILAQAGIEASSGLLEQEARSLNPGFIQSMEKGLPFVRLKQAMSLDGRTAMASGESKWVTGPEARADVQRLRAESSAILTGIDSILHDDSALTVRSNELPALLQTDDISNFLDSNPPLRVVVDSSLRLPPDARILGQPGATLVATVSTDADKKQSLEKAGAQVLVLPAIEGRVDLLSLWLELAGRGHHSVLLECGSTLAGSALSRGLVDEMIVYMAPKLLGNKARGLVSMPFESMQQAMNVSIKEIRAIGADWRIIATPEKTEE